MVEYISLHRCIKNTSTDGTVLAEHQRTLAEDLEHWKGQWRFLHNRVGWKKEGRKKRRGCTTGPVPLGESWSRGEFPTSGETLSPMGKSVGTERKHLRQSEEGEAAGLWQTGKSENYTDGLWHGHACPGLGRVSNSVHGGWELERGDKRAKLVGGVLLAVRRQPEGEGGRKSASRNVCGGNLECHWSKAPLLIEAQRVEKTLHSLSPHMLAPAPLGARKGPRQGWPSRALAKSPPRARSLTPVSTVFPTHLLPPGLPQPRQLCLVWALSSPGQTWVLQGSLGSRLLSGVHTQRWG